MLIKKNNKIIVSDGVLKKETFKDEVLITRQLIFSGTKVFLSFFLVFVLFLTLFRVGGTVSYFTDVEMALSNYLRADPISFQVSSDKNQIDLSQGDALVTIVMTPDAISDPIQYFVSSNVVEGDLDFCNAVSVSGTWPFPVSGLLTSTITETSIVTGSWTLTINVPEVYRVANKSCLIELTYLGWNAGAELGRSFSDTKKISFTFYIPSDYNLSQPISSAPQSFVQEDNSQNEITHEVQTEVETEGNLPESETIEVKEEIVISETNSEQSSNNSAEVVVTLEDSEQEVVTPLIPEPVQEEAPPVPIAPPVQEEIVQ